MSRTRTDQDVFRAIADPTRRALLNALLTGPKGFAELHGTLSLTKGAVSQHLSILASVGLIAIDDADRSRRYSLTPAPLVEVDRWMAAYRTFWEERLDRLDQALEHRRAARPRGPR